MVASSPLRSLLRCRVRRKVWVGAPRPVKNLLESIRAVRNSVKRLKGYYLTYAELRPLPLVSDMTDSPPPMRSVRTMRTAVFCPLPSRLPPVLVYDVGVGQYCVSGPKLKQQVDGRLHAIFRWPQAILTP